MITQIKGGLQIIITDDYILNHLSGVYEVTGLDPHHLQRLKEDFVRCWNNADGIDSQIDESWLVVCDHYKLKGWDE